MSSSLFWVNHQPSSSFVLPLIFFTILIRPENSLNNFCYPQMLPVWTMCFFLQMKKMCKIKLFQYKSVEHSAVNICQGENWLSSLFASWNWVITVNSHFMPKILNSERFAQNLLKSPVKWYPFKQYPFYNRGFDTECLLFEYIVLKIL